jgi:hypothetical protein
MATLDEISKEKQRVSEVLARVDAQREKLVGQLGELEATEPVLARYSKGPRLGAAPTDRCRQRFAPGKAPRQNPPAPTLAAYSNRLFRGGGGIA